MSKMYKVYVHGFIFLGLFGVSITHILTPQNDWIPISNDEVLRRLSRLNRRNADNSQFYPIKNETTTLNTFKEANNEKIFINNAIKLVQPVKTIKLDQGSEYYPVTPDTITSVNELQSSLQDKYKQEPQSKIETNFEKSLKLEKHNNADNIIDTNFRKAKEILPQQFANNIKYDEFVSTRKLENEETEKEYSQVTVQDNRKIYEVTEDAAEPIDNKKSDTEERTGYFYVPPKLYQDNSMENNFTKMFLDILSKHNIRPGDDLPNYSLSRRQKKQNPLNAYMLIPIPSRDFSQFNNLNIDPLGVLLSNYGYYIPGLYGIRGKYRNLYGYLALNNIHNNKPFGAYKILSDTDSSN